MPPLLIVGEVDSVQFEVYVASAQFQILLHVLHLVERILRQARFVDHFLVEDIGPPQLLLIHYFLIYCLCFSVLIISLDFSFPVRELPLPLIRLQLDMLVLLNGCLVFEQLLFLEHPGLEPVSYLLDLFLP